MLKIHSVNLDTDTVDEIDKIIGRDSRSAWIMEAIKEKLNNVE